MTLTGGCFCGRVRYRINAALSGARDSVQSDPRYQTDGSPIEGTRRCGTAQDADGGARESGIPVRPETLRSSPVSYCRVVRTSILELSVR